MAQEGKEQVSENLACPVCGRTPDATVPGEVRERRTKRDYRTQGRLRCGECETPYEMGAADA